MSSRFASPSAPWLFNSPPDNEGNELRKIITSENTAARQLIRYAPNLFSAYFVLRRVLAQVSLDLSADWFDSLVEDYKPYSTEQEMR